MRRDAKAGEMVEVERVGTRKKKRAFFSLVDFVGTAQRRASEFSTANAKEKFPRKIECAGGGGSTMKMREKKMMERRRETRGEEIRN